MWKPGRVVVLWKKVRGNFGIEKYRCQYKWGVYLILHVISRFLNLIF